MELLIPGLILVALMVYASTRIKRAAARAYETEQIEEEYFSLTKPEGLLHRISGSDHAFEAYSREFGPEPADDIRAATAIVDINDGLDLSSAASVERGRMSFVRSEEYFELDRSHVALLEGELVRNGNTIDVKSKIIAKDGRTLVLRAEVLRELSADFARKTEDLLSSFVAK